MKTINIINSDQKIYNLIKEKFDHPGVTLFRGRELSALNNFFVKHSINKNQKILDLGCGEGEVAKILFSRVSTGLDILESELNKASKLNLYQKLVSASAKEMPFKSKTFDIVFSNSVIEHIPDIEAVISEVARVLKDGGLFVFTSPSRYFSKYLLPNDFCNKHGLKLISKTYTTFRNKQLCHFNQYNLSGWSHILSMYGLKVSFHQYYLSKKEIEKWDQICILLRISSIVPFIYNYLKRRFEKEVDNLLRPGQNIKKGGSLLVVAKRKW